MSGLYEPIGEEMVDVLAGEFLVEGSELNDAVAVAGTAVYGIIASYPSSEYRVRQNVSLHYALTNLGADAGRTLVAQLRSLVGQFPQADPQGEYLARFAVTSELRGRGLADDLFKVFLSTHPKVSLHVRTDNARAIAFYKRYGLSAKAAGNQFILMGCG